MFWLKDICPAEALWIIALPCRSAMFRSDIEVLAISVPFMMEFVPRVIAEPATQNTFFACALPSSTTALVLSVVMDVSLRIMNTAFESPCPSRYKIPPGEIWMEELDSYNPGASVSPFKSPEIHVGVPRDAFMASM